MSVTFKEFRLEARRNTSSGPIGGGNLSAQRADAQRSLQAIDDAISRGLSEDSQTYNQSTQQTGAQ